MLIFALIGAVGCGNTPPPAKVASKPPPPKPSASAPEEPLPPHLAQFPGLYVRKGDQIIDAPPADVAVAKSYARSKEKGAVVDGHRLTILAAKHRYRVGEEVRVIHVHEVVASGEMVYVMGPKPIRGELLDGKLATPMVLADGDPFVPEIYDGVTLQSPAADYNWEITSYRFSAPGTHRIQWRLGRFDSNVLTIEVGP
ncbi:MAG: hypothetical protein ACXWUG_03830 [Polyangiales bacterium]